MTTTKATPPVTEAPKAEAVEVSTPATISEEIVTKADQLATRAAAAGWSRVRMEVARFFAGANIFLDGLAGENAPKTLGTNSSSGEKKG